MKITPLDIRKQEFKRTMRGLDPDEVEAFLSMIADEFELLIREKNQINDELIKLRTQLKDYQQVEQTLRDTLVKAQNTVEDSRANSRREAEIIIHEAELQAEHIVKEAKEELYELKNDIYMIKMQKESFAKRLKHLLESQIELLQVLEMDDEEIDEYVDRRRRTTRSSQDEERPENTTRNRMHPEPEEEDSFQDRQHEPRIVRDRYDEIEQPDEFEQKHKGEDTGKDDDDDDDDRGNDGDDEDRISDQLIL